MRVLFRYSDGSAEFEGGLVRQNYAHQKLVESPADLLANLRAGRYAWPGGYPLYFATGAGEAISFQAFEDRDFLREELRKIYRGEPGRILGSEVNWEDPDLCCDVTGERIESAYV